MKVFVGLKFMRTMNGKKIESTQILRRNGLEGTKGISDGSVGGNHNVSIAVAWRGVVDHR
jgi:hypothetical protein